MGAQWIHGQEDNPLYDYCSKRGLVSEDQEDVGDERSGQYRSQDGKIINPDVVNFVVSHLDAVKISPSVGEEDTSSSVGHFLQKELDYLLSQDHGFEEDCIRAVFRWFLTFELIDNACSDLSSLSCKSYTEWIDCPGELINFKNGFSSVIETLVKEIPSDTIKMQSKVTRIEWDEKGDKVNIFVGNQVISVDYVILTVSLGVLKGNDITFHPHLSSTHDKIIQSNGYGTINKIFLRFPRIFWTDDKYSLKLIWTEERNKIQDQHPNLPDWVFDISGFDTVRGTSDMLMAWIGGKGAEMAEIVGNDKVGQVCCQLLRMFTGLQIEEAVDVIMSKWYSNPLFRGSYSHPTTACDTLTTRFLPPLKFKSSTGEMIDRIIFAGEANDKEFYSSTHGAFRSGKNAAEQILSNLKKVDK